MHWVYPDRWTRVALEYPRAAALVIVLITAWGLMGVVRIESAVGYRAFLGEHHPVIRELDDFVGRFGGGLPLLAVWTCGSNEPCADALDAVSLKMSYDVARRLMASAVVRGVDSPATTAILARQPLGFPAMRVMVRDGVIAKDIDDLRRQALEDPSWLGRIVSADAKTGALVVHLRDSASATAVEVFSRLREAVAPYEEIGFDYAFVGGPVEFVVAGADLEANTRRIVPVMVGLIAIALLVLFGSLAAAAVALLAVGIAIIWTLGLMGWLGWPQNSLTQILPPLVLVIGVCDAIHLLGRYAALDRTSSPPDAIRRAASEVAAACWMTSATTIAGFASLATSGLESIARFGVVAGFAVAAALVLTFVAVPLLVSRMPRSWFVPHGYGSGWQRALAGVATFATGKGKAWILGAALGAAVLASLGLRGLRVDATFEDLYGKDSDVVRWVETTAQRLRAPESIEIELRPPPMTSGVHAAGFDVANRIQEWASHRNGLGRSLSVVDAMRRLNELLHRDDLPLDPAGDDKGRPSSIYRLLRNRDPGVTDELVDSSRGSLRVSIETTKLPQEELRQLILDASTEIEATLPEGWAATLTGPAIVISRMIDAIRSTQLRSFVLAAVAVFAMVSLFFRSIAFGFMAMVPTALPVVVTLGAMGWLGIPLDIGTAMVASVILGLAVDDAIHLITRYAEARKRGGSAPEAARRAVLHTGRALATTSLALAIGFLTLGLSSWDSIASFGVIAAVSVLTALLAALFVLPAIASGR